MPLFFVAAIGLGGLALFAALSSRAAPPDSAPPPQSGGGAAPPRAAPQGDGPAADELGAKGLLDLAGIAGGILARESAFTQTAKDAALPTGVAVAGAAALLASSTAAAAGISILGAAAYWAVPVVLVTVAIVTIIDGITRAVKQDRWRVLCISIRDMRARGDLPGAMALHAKAIAEVDEIARRDPAPPSAPGLGQRDDSDWYNPLDPLGRPYPGYPGPPSPANAAELAQWPHLLPTTLNNKDGYSVNIRDTLAPFEADVRDCRAWGMANGVPGVVVGPGIASAPATHPERYATFRVVTKGDRDLSGWAPLEERRAMLAQVRASIFSVIPWLDGSAIVAAFGLSEAAPAEAAVTRARRDADARSGKSMSGGTLAVGATGKVVTVPLGTKGAVSPRQVSAVARVTGLKGTAAVQVAQVERAETAASKAATTRGARTSNAATNTSGSSSSGAAGSGSTGASHASNTNSGTSEGGHAGGNAGRWGD